MSIIRKRLADLVASDVNANGEISNEQVTCAKEVLSAFDSDYPKSNYLIVKGQTQSGKTGVLFGTVNIINKLRLKDALNIDKVFYLTADNSKGLTRQQEERAKKDLMHFNDEDVSIIFLKRSDFKNYKKDNCTIDNSIIFIDESDYGTSKTVNLLPQFLKFYGIDYLKNTNLEEHNIRVVSNTATPYSELASDVAENKIHVLLEPGPGYIGILNFAENGNVVQLKENVFKRNLVDTYLPKLFTDVHSYLKDIETGKGKVKCAIFRACGRCDVRNIEKYGSEFFDIFQFDTTRSSVLDYESLWNKIDVYCGMGEGRTEGKYLLVVVKGALRRGISIREKENENRTKNRIAVLYDYPSDDEKPDITEQGLLGRMTGYRKEGDDEWKDIRFYLNDVHFTSLKNFYENGLRDEKGQLKKMVIAEFRATNVEVSDTTGLISEYDAEKNGMDKEALLKEGKLYKIDVPEKNDFYEVYDATEYFMDKVGTSFAGFDNFQLSDLKTPRAMFAEKFIRTFLKTKDDHYGDGMYVNKGCRRTGIGVGQKVAAFIKNLKDGSSRMMISDSAYPMKNDDAGKYAYQALLNMDQMEDPINPKIFVHVKVAQMKTYLQVKSVMVSGEVRTAETMMTE